MTSLLKFALPGILGVGSAGVVGSNWVFKKDHSVLVASDNSAEWNSRAEKLLEKIAVGNEDLKNQIVGIQGNEGSLELNSNDGGSNASFRDKSKATQALKSWCQNKKDSNDATVKELCKETQWVGWLFGDQRR